MYLGATVPSMVASDGLEERTMQHHELDIHQRRVRVDEVRHVGRMIQRLVRHGYLFGRHGQPLVLPLDAVRAVIVLLPGGEGGPLDQDVLLPVVGTRLFDHPFYELGIVHGLFLLESPFLDAIATVPSEEAGLEILGIVGHVVLDAVLVPLSLRETLDDGDEAVVGGALDAHDVDHLAPLSRCFVRRQPLLHLLGFFAGRIAAKGERLRVINLSDLGGQLTVANAVVPEEGRLLIVSFDQ
mmetsp:Transcript_55294/g.117583  ORF Transcript_55294/g.117583 Transcript_55294/m.117583 type:complete len:240 (-) Transcript_55294:196-915(-)